MQVWVPSSVSELLPSCGICLLWLGPWGEVEVHVPSTSRSTNPPASQGACLRPRSWWTSHEHGLGSRPESLLPTACPGELLQIHSLCKTFAAAFCKNKPGEKPALVPSLHLFFCLHRETAHFPCCFTFHHFMPLLMFLWKESSYYVTFYRKDNCFLKAKWIASMEEVGSDSAVAIFWHV